MIKDGHTLPCYFADGFYKPTTKIPFTSQLNLVWFNDDFCLIFTLQDFLGRMTKIEDQYWIETDSFVHSLHSKNPKPLLVLKVQNIHLFMLLIHNILTTQVPHFSKYILQLKHFVANQIHFILHNIQIFLLHTLMVSICIYDNPILTLLSC